MRGLELGLEGRWLAGDILGLVGKLDQGRAEGLDDALRRRGVGLDIASINFRLVILGGLLGYNRLEGDPGVHDHFGVLRNWRSLLEWNRFPGYLLAIDMLNLPALLELEGVALLLRLEVHRGGLLDNLGSLAVNACLPRLLHPHWLWLLHPHWLWLPNSSIDRFNPRDRLCLGLLHPDCLLSLLLLLVIMLLGRALLPAGLLLRLAVP